MPPAAELGARTEYVACELPPYVDRVVTRPEYSQAMGE